MHNYALICLAVLLATCSPRSAAVAQERFELVVPQAGINSQAELSSGELRVQGSDGRLTNYTRDARFDSADGQWLGYYSRAANQILRWPASNSGNMQIGTLRGNAVEYRASQMSIKPLGGVAERVAQRPQLPESARALGDWPRSELFTQMGSGDADVNRGELLRVASFDRAGTPWLLSGGAGLEVRGVPAATAQSAEWWIAPAGAGLFRIQTYDRGQVTAVSASRANSLQLQPLASDAAQLWRAVGGHADQRFVLANAMHHGQCLTHLGGGRLMLQPINFAPNQIWLPYAPPPTMIVQPFWRSISRDVRANPPLPPAQVELVNSHRYALLVLLGDLRQLGTPQTIRIEPNSSVQVSLERDAGATMVETMEIRSATGIWDRQELVTTIPATNFYDLSVYEEHLQSIAIDRTGKSPNPIEDVNYVPKSVGWLTLAAGANLPDRSRIDLYPAAKDAKNPGAVRRLDPKQFDEPSSVNPLESILDEFRSPPRRSF